MVLLGNKVDIFAKTLFNEGEETMRRMKISIIGFIAIIFGLGIFMFIFGGVLMTHANDKIMEDYNLYHCVYNNAASNGFPTNEIIVDKIQRECVCFMEQDWNVTKIWEEC